MKKRCRFPKCENTGSFRGLCTGHYMDKEVRAEYAEPSKRGQKSSGQPVAKKKAPVCAAVVEAVVKARVPSEKVDPLDAIFQDAAAAISDLVDARVDLSLSKLLGMARSVRNLAIETRMELRKTANELGSFRRSLHPARRSKKTVAPEL